MNHRSETDLYSEIREAERCLDELGARHRRLWDKLRIAPTKWVQQTYPDVGPVWVIGLLGTRCLCVNPVEGGWGWGQFDTWGTISEFHWQQDEIQHVVNFTLFAIDHGGQS